MSDFSKFLSSAAGKKADNTERQKRRINLFIEGIEPQSKRMKPADQTNLQQAIADHLKWVKRTAFTGPIALKLDLHTTDKNAPQAHTIAKNLLDLFSNTRADVDWSRPHLLYEDDKQIQALSVACRHGCTSPVIIVEVAPLEDVLDELKIATEVMQQEDMSSDAMDREDMAKGSIDELKHLMANEQQSRATFGGMYEPYLKMTRWSAQSELLKQGGLKIPLLHYLYDNSLLRLGLAPVNWAELICQSALRMQFGELPIAPGESKAFRVKVQEVIETFKTQWAWIIEPLHVAVALEVIVRPSPDTPRGVLHDLDNIVRDYLIPGIVPKFDTVTDQLWHADSDALEKVVSEPTAWSPLRSTPRLPPGTRAGVTRYEVWRLPPVEGQPGFLSVALIDDSDGRGSLMEQIRTKVEQGACH